MTPRARISRFAVAQEGAAAIEFAIVAPVFMILLLGVFDIGQMAYGRAILSGAVEKAARSASMETVDTTALDTMVKAAIKPILPNATFVSTRKSYYDFADINRPEKFTDSDGNGTCNAGEPYVDENRSGQWDADIGKAGNGVVANTSGGSITVDSAQGDVNLDTSGGSIKVGAIAGKADLDTSGGSITIDSVMNSVRASTSGGGIRANIVGTLREDSSLSTSGGGIRVTLDKSAAFNLDASTSGGGVDADGLTITLKDAGQRGKNRLAGAVNGGGPALKLRTSGGGIDISTR